MGSRGTRNLQKDHGDGNAGALCGYKRDTFCYGIFRIHTYTCARPF
jgi:hypothetical protein